MKDAPDKPNLFFSASETVQSSHRSNDVQVSTEIERSTSTPLNKPTPDPFNIKLKKIAAKQAFVTEESKGNTDFKHKNSGRTNDIVTVYEEKEISESEIEVQKKKPKPKPSKSRFHKKGNRSVVYEEGPPDLSMMPSFVNEIKDLQVSASDLPRDVIQAQLESMKTMYGVYLGEELPGLVYDLMNEV